MLTKRLGDFLRELFEPRHSRHARAADQAAKPLVTENHSGPVRDLSKDEPGPHPVPEISLPNRQTTAPGGSFLYQEAIWEVKGVYVNEKSVSITVEGSSQISHSENRWTNKVNMILKAENGVEYRNLESTTVYEYASLGPEDDYVAWHASDDMMGRMHGIFVFFSDTILSSYQTRSGMIRGSEIFVEESGSEYQCRGALFEAGNKSSSWELRYIKQSK